MIPTLKVMDIDNVLDIKDSRTSLNKTWFLFNQLNKEHLNFWWDLYQLCPNKMIGHAHTMRVGQSKSWSIVTWFEEGLRAKTALSWALMQWTPHETFLRTKQTKRKETMRMEILKKRKQFREVETSECTSVSHWQHWTEKSGSHL